MEQELRTKLKLTEDSFYKLRQNFEHNVKVIEQLQQQNDMLKFQIEKRGNENEISNSQFRKTTTEIHQQQINSLRRDFDLQVNQLSIAHQKELQQMIEMMNSKMRSQIAYIQKKNSQQIQYLKSLLSKAENSQKFLLSENQKAIENIKEHKLEKQNLQQQIIAMKLQRQAMINRYELSQRQIEGIRNSDRQWQQSLTSKIRELQRHKQQALQENEQIKRQFKDKLRKIKQQHARKLMQITDQKQESVRKILLDSKEIKYKYDSVIADFQSVKRDLEKKEFMLKNVQEKLSKLEKEKQQGKQQQYLKRMYEQEKEYFRNQISMLKTENKSLKSELEQVNEKRQENQIKLAKLKTVHTSKLAQLEKVSDELKQLRKRQVRNQQDHERNQQKYQQGDESRLFSQDQGGFDQDFFWKKSQKMSQLHQPSSPLNKNVNNRPQHQLMKRIGQLQLQNDQLKDVIKRISEDLERIKNSFDDKLDFKEKELKLAREQNRILREKINDRENQILNQKQSSASLRLDVENLLKFKENSGKYEREAVQFREKFSKLQKQAFQKNKKCEMMAVQLKNLQQQRDALQAISTQLKAQINNLQQKVEQVSDQGYQGQVNEQVQNSSQFRQGQSQWSSIPRTSNIYPNQHRQRANSQNNHILPNQNPQNNYNNANRVNDTNTQKRSHKLYELIKQKKNLELVGQKANIQMKVQQQPIYHKATQSQKHKYQMIKQRNKTPPKHIANFNLLKTNNVQGKQEQ